MNPVDHDARPRRNLWADVLPVVVLLAPFAVILLLDSSVLLSGFRSPRALLLMAVFAVFWVVIAYVVLPRLLRGAWTRCAVLCVFAAVVGTLIAVPAFRSTEVVETRAGFDTARRATTAGATTGSSASPTTTGTTGATRDPAPSTTTTPAPPADGMPRQLSTGAFTGIDHRAEGTANVFRQPDGKLVVELHDIDFQSGPDYVVYLVPGEGARSPTDGAVDLGRIKGNRGTQYYDVPGDYPTDGPQTVLVWCRAFAVPIGNAPQTEL